MNAQRHGIRWFRRGLALADPLALAQSTELYLASLSADRLAELVLRSTSRMSEGLRSQLEQYVEVQRIAAGEDPLLARRFTVFLRENPRAIEALGNDALARIFERLDVPVRAQRMTRMTRLSLQGVTLAALAVLVAFVPLWAQYAHQRAIVQGLAVAGGLTPRAVPAAPRPRSVAARTRSKTKPRPRPIARPHDAAPARRLAFTATLRHARSTVPIRRAKAIGRQARRMVVPRNWKFYPRNYAYFNRRTPPSFAQRARLDVQAYLNDVIAGRTALALAHLGLPPGASAEQISEAPIVARTSRARVIDVKPQSAGAARVEADISGRHGEYFEVFHVASDGPAVRITDRYYIPVSR